MTLVERRIFRINDFVDNINPAQICVEPMEDPDLDFRMYCGTDILGNATKWLAKDQKARITDLSITDRLNMNTNDVVNAGSLYAPWTDLDNDIWARLRFYYNGAYPTSEFVQARPGLECGVRLDATQSKADFFCDTNRGLFFNGPEMTLEDYDADESRYNFSLLSDSSGANIFSNVLFKSGYINGNTSSFFLANTPLAGRSKSGIYAIDEDNSFECYVTAEAGTDGLEVTGTDLTLYSSHGKILAGSGLNGILRIDADIFLSGDGLEFLDKYRSTSDYTGGYIPLSKSIDEWSAFAAIAGATGSLLGAFGECYSGDLQRAYDNGHSVTVDDGVCSWVVPSDAATSYAAQSFSNLKADNSSELVLIHNDSTHADKKALYFSGAAGDASSSGALGHKIWTNDSISIGRTNSASYSSYCVANAANISDTVVATRAQLYADGTDDFSNDVESYISVIAGKQGSEGSRARFSTIYGYSEVGQAVLESGLGGKLTLGNSAILGSTASTLSFYDSYRITSDYSATSVPLAKSIAEWSAFAAIAGAEGSLLGGIAASKLGPAISAGQVAYGTGTSIAGKSTFVFDPSGGDTLSIGGLSASTRMSLAGTTAAGGSFSSRVYSTTADTAAGLAFSRSRHATLGTHGAVTTADVLSNILSYGSDGSTFVLAASIAMRSGGDFSSAAGKSGYIQFSTRDADTYAERMRLTSAGYLGLGTDTPENGFHVKGTGTLAPTVRADCFSTTGSDVASMRLYKSNHASTYGALASGDLIGRIRFIGSRPSSWADGCIIEALSAGSWATSAGETVNLRVQLRHAGTSATRFLLTSDSRIAVGPNAVPDWSHSQVLASQMLDGSTAGSSQSIVAMTLGLRTTSTTANQVLKLTSSDSASPLAIADGYYVSFLVNVTGAGSAGDQSVLYPVSLIYHVSVHVISGAGTVTSHRLSTQAPNSSNVAGDEVGFSYSSGVLNIGVTPRNNTTIDWVATISCGVKTKAVVVVPS